MKFKNAELKSSNIRNDSKRHTYIYDIAGPDPINTLCSILDEFAISYNPNYIGFGLEMYRDDDTTRSVQVFFNAITCTIQLDILIHDIEEFYYCHDAEKAS